jgi:hypothetical protein
LGREGGRRRAHFIGSPAAAVLRIPAGESPARRSHPRRTAALALYAALALGSGLTAYHYSLASLFGADWPAALILTAGVVLTGLIALADRTPVPDIHDRYTDLIVGIPLLLTALAIQLLLPAQLSLFFWLSRIDLLSIPLFCAGVLSLAFGIRVLWRFRLPVFALGAAWPIFGMGVFTGIARSLAAALVIAVALGLAVRARAVRPPPSPVRTNGTAPVRRANLAVALVAVAGIAAGVADAGMRQYGPLLGGDGTSRLRQPVPVTQVGDWNLVRTDHFAWIGRYLGRDATWDRYTYRWTSSAQPAPGSLVGLPLLVDVIATPRLNDLSSSGLEPYYRLGTGSLIDSHAVALPQGIIGHAAVYADHEAHTDWVAVYWDWPLDPPEGRRYQRVIVSVTDAQAAELTAFSADFVAAAAARAVAATPGVAP